MKQHKKKLLILGIVTIVLLGASVAFSSDTSDKRELYVYSIKVYGQQYDAKIGFNRYWKEELDFPPLPDGWPQKDPYSNYGLWGILYTNCIGAGCAMKRVDGEGSMRRQNSAVTVNTMAQTTDGWPDADMVVFFGHNSQIQPQWEFNGMKVWLEWLLGGWYETTLDDWQEWGTYDNPTTDPYKYHYREIDDASILNGYSIFYAYKPLTSILIGEDFTDGTWYTENTKDGTPVARSGRLPNEIEWIVALGCNAVTVAKYSPTTTSCNPSTVEDDCNSNEGCWDQKCQEAEECFLGMSAWGKTWGKQHLVLGHYHGTHTNTLPDSDELGGYWKSGDTVKDGYFDAHQAGTDGLCDVPPYYIRRNNPLEGPGYCQPSVIAQSPDSCCYPCGQRTCCPTEGCAGDFLHHDKWTDSDPDLTGDVYFPIVYAVTEYPD